MFKSNYYKLFLKLNKIDYGKKINFYGMPIIFKNKGSVLKIGNNCTIKSSFLSNLIGINHRTIIVARTKEAKVIIGNNVGMSGATIYSREKIVIGNNTFIGANVKILDNDFHPLDIDDRNNDNKNKIKSKEINIGENCFIGVNSIILKGTTIGNGSIVGAGSVVTGKFPENVILAGNPAKIIKEVNR